MNTPVLVFAKADGAVPECSTARHAVSSNSRCCGSINMASRADTPKNGASNPVTSSMKPARRVDDLPGRVGIWVEELLDIPAVLGHLRDRIPTVPQHIPELVGIGGTGKARRVADDRKTRCRLASDLRQMPCGCPPCLGRCRFDPRGRPRSAPGLASDGHGQFISRQPRPVNLPTASIAALASPTRGRYPAVVAWQHPSDRAAGPACSTPGRSVLRSRHTSGARTGDGGSPQGYVDVATSVAGDAAAVQTREEILRIGKVTIGSIDDWTLSPGVVTSWHPTNAAHGKGPASAGQFGTGQLYAGPTYSRSFTNRKPRGSTIHGKSSLRAKCPVSAIFLP